MQSLAWTRAIHQVRPWHFWSRYVNASAVKHSNTWGRKEIHRRESSFSSSFSKGFIPEKHILVFLAHTSTKGQFHNSSLCLGRCYFPSNHSLLLLPVLLIHLAPGCESELEKMKLWPESLSSLKQPQSQVQSLTQKVWRHLSPSYWACFIHSHIHTCPLFQPNGASGRCSNWPGS